LERVLIAGCSPRLVEPLFQRCAQDAGLCASDIATTNIREQCAYIHAEDRQASLEKAGDLIAMGVARLAHLSQRRTYAGTIEQAALVVGTGLGAHAVALALAENDIPVKLVELDAHMEPRSSGLPDWAQALAGEGACAVKGHPNIQPLAGARLLAVDGRAGQYRIDIEQRDEHLSCLAGAVVLVGDCSEVAVAGDDLGANPPLRASRHPQNGPPSNGADPHFDALSALFQLPRDNAGYLGEPRMQLRPDWVVDDGIFICGGAHQPTDASELLYQAYVVAGRVTRFMRQKTMTLSRPVVEIDAALCTGCGTCVQVCPTSAIRMQDRERLLSQAHVDWTRCIGCGNCVVACPVKSLRLPEWDDGSIFAQIEAAFPNRELAGRNGQLAHQAKIVVLGCSWSAYAAADIAGSRRCSYPPGTRLIRLSCAARFDPFMALWALIHGADGVVVGTCCRDHCHYGSGNLYAEQRVQDLRQQMAEYGLDQRRLRLLQVSSEDGEGLARALSDFAQELEMVIVRREQLVQVP
jgi:coenzyme F420-reducing hydrogenase delta subunit/NAD-dependent dihydropyrimidine dehydrogenase PreA subunit